MTSAHNNFRLGFFIVHNFHHAMLDSIYEDIKNDVPCLMTNDYKKMVAYQPNIIVLSEHHNAFFRSVLPETIIVHTTHGLNSKNYANLPWFDFECVSSNWRRDYHINKERFPRLGFWVTGFSATDTMLQTSTCKDKPAILEHKGPGPTLLYAPTFTPKLTAIEVLGSEWIKTLRQKWPDLNIIIKLHPHTARVNPAWVEMYKQAANRIQGTYFLETDANIYDYLKFADILLTDVSSVTSFYLFFNRPIILVTNPHRFENKVRFEPDGFMWQWRDMGIEIDKVQDLLPAVERSLQFPNEKEAKRLLYKERIFGDLLDGKASSRIADKIRALIQPTPEDEEWVQIAWNSIRALARQKKPQPLGHVNIYETAKIVYKV